MSFVPGICGEHELDITIENQPIRGSPFHIYVRKERQYEANMSRQLSFGISNAPADVTVDDTGNVYVTCSDSNCIKVFDRKGSLLHTITNDDGHFSKPNGIAALDGILYVTDASHYSVVKMTTSGEFLSKFGTEQLSSPRGICLSYDGRIFIASEGNNRVSVFEPDGTFAYHITGSTVDKSNLRSPWGVAFDSSGDLHVTNHGSNDVFVFMPEGEYKTKYSCGISELAGIAISADGYSFGAKNSSSDSRLLSLIIFIRRFIPLKDLCMPEEWQSIWMDLFMLQVTNKTPFTNTKLIIRILQNLQLPL